MLSPASCRLMMPVVLGHNGEELRYQVLELVM